MTTKYKIIAGFACMMVILLVTAFLGYSYLDKSIAGLLEYRRIARMNVRTSDALTALNVAALGASRFTASFNTADIDSAIASIDTLDSTLAAAKADMSDTGRLATTDRMRAAAQQYKTVLGTLRTTTLTVQEQYRNQVVPNARSIVTAFGQMAETAARNNNIPLLTAIQDIWSDFSLLLPATARFYAAHAKDDLTIIQSSLTAINAKLKAMDAAIYVPAVRDIFTSQVVRSIENVASAVNGLVNAAAEADTALGAALTTRNAIINDLATLSDHYNTMMNTYGGVVTGESQSGQAMLLGGSAAGILLGLILAALIILGLIRVLRDLSGYADHIAKGDFEYQVKTREKGEVGAMLHAMHAIPEVLERLIADAGDVAERIHVGDYRARINAGRFSGGFKDMAQSVSMVSDAYTEALDQIPLAIITADKDYTMLFINATTKAVLGSDMTGRNCGNCFKAPTCDTNDCFAAQARATGKPASGETTIYPDSGVNLTISVTAIPFFDKQGSLAGHMEICTDISALHNKQKAILSVAEKATTISDRIAAASEELSAQVEQVSRGADMQRDRVSSTASAMTEMNSTVLEVAKSAGEASEQSENTRIKAQQGADLVGQVVTAINAVNVVGQALSTNMQELGTQAESIGGVMNVISDIADQTNLLALNAAIEAARAGEAGRGFAVVADEVRKLAEKTMQATHEVGSSISAIQQSAQVNVTEVGKAVASVAEADKLAISSGEALKEIVNMASANSAVVASIATASEEQSATSEEISSATEEINRIVAETADGMVQSSAAVQELSQMAQELRRVMEELK